ncbi:MAG: SDR family oxidoreductase, partial [Gammaproteobacteria bacterium]
MSSNPRVCVITGAGAGIGKACVNVFARQGYHVLAADVDGEAAAITARDVHARYGIESVGFACNVSVPSDCKAVADEAQSRWGRIDALVGNAGIQTSGRLLDSTEAEWTRLVDVNLKGILNSCRAVLPAMIPQHDGRIVLVSSINAVLAPAGMTIYDMT